MFVIVVALALGVVWLSVSVLVVALCVAARRGDEAQAVLSRRAAVSGRRPTRRFARLSVG